MRDPPRRRPIPLPQPREHRPRQQAPHGPIGPALQVGLAPLPGISHRREAIADVRDALRRHDRLGHAMAQADHQVDVSGPPGPRSHRHDRQQVAIVAEDAGYPLKRRSPDRHRLDRRAERASLMDQGIKRGIGKRPAEHFQTLLAAAHPGQPIVYQSDAQSGQRRTGGTDLRAALAQPRNGPNIAVAGIHAGLPGQRVIENGRPGRLAREVAHPRTQVSDREPTRLRPIGQGGLGFRRKARTILFADGRGF